MESLMLEISFIGKNDPGRIFNFDMIDHRGCSLPCRVSKEYASAFLDKLDGLDISGVIICIIQFARIELKQGNWYAIVAHGSTKIFIQPMLPKALAMKTTILNGPIYSPRLT
ncbi:unnamed protein product [Arabis nemorensis]|uniref:Uncharacterized protein n=1 Tax=Arabis nemorensis TaxID=586526 RepID=A0A565AXS1_9BRAS|nr:unnamed protein product [Arabis nemorensis]